MKTRVLAGILAGLCLAALHEARAGEQEEARLAGDHLSAIMLIQRFAQAIYRVTPPVDRGCEPTDTGPVSNGDGTSTRVITTRGCVRIVIVTRDDSASDYTMETIFPDGLRESLEARTLEQFFGGPGLVRFTHRLSSGDVVEYDTALQQVPVFDEEGNFIAAFFYGLISQGTVRLAGGQSLEFELRQTTAFDCFDFFGNPIPEEECAEWFIINKDGTVTPKPDRLSVRLAGGTGGSMSLEFPVIFGIIDSTRNTTGTLTLGRRRLGVTLVPAPTPDPFVFAGWRYWLTRGAQFRGTFELQRDFAGRGQAFQPRSGNRGRRLRFAARWNRQGVGTIVLSDGQTRPAGPTAGLLEFGNLKWTGLASAFGPNPGL